MPAESPRSPCPVCGRAASPRDGTPKNPAFPFCSRTCKLVDLSHWLSDKYRVPGTDEGSSDATGPSGNEPKGQK